MKIIYIVQTFCIDGKTMHLLHDKGNLNQNQIKT